MEDNIFNQNLIKSEPNSTIASTPPTPNKLPNQPTPTPSVTSGYYRTKLFTTNISSNQLVDAAAAVFSLASSLSKIAPPKDRDKLLADLAHEIKAFENKAQVFGYRSTLILAARYALCALLDELIIKTSWGKSLKWEQDNLLQLFHHEPSGEERFFSILTRAFDDPVIYLDLLELLYLCLNLGFEGKYQQKEGGNHELVFITNNLFNRINQQRGDISKSLSITLKAPNHLVENQPINNSLSWWLLIAIILLVNLGIFAGLDWHLKIISKQVLNQYELAN